MTIPGAASWLIEMEDGMIQTVAEDYTMFAK